MVAVAAALRTADFAVVSGRACVWGHPAYGKDEPPAPEQKLPHRNKDSRTEQGARLAELETSSPQDSMRHQERLAMGTDVMRAHDPRAATIRSHRRHH